MARPPALIDDEEWNSLGALMHLSHEIRTPLNSMLVLSQLLRDGTSGPLNADQQKYIEVIERNGLNVIGLVNDVMDLSRLQLGRMRVDVQSIDLGDHLRAIAKTLAPLAARKGIDLAVEVPGGLPAVRADPDRVRQVLTNLVGDAIKHTERGRVLLSSEKKAGALAVHVCDTGAGFSAAVLKRLFEEFFQADAPGARRNAGSGLGLAIAHKLVRLMGGELSVVSTEGVGSRFTFTLPTGSRELPASSATLARRGGRVRGSRRS